MKTTAEEFDRLRRPLELDLIAFFHLLLKKTQKRVDEALQKGWTPEQLIDSMNDII